MSNNYLFQLALELNHPWEVTSSEFDPTKKQLVIQIDFQTGSTFSCSACGLKQCRVHDTEQRSWRHLNFFQHESYIKTNLPRTNCPDCGLKWVQVPWARATRKYTRLFEAYVGGC